ncbi:hypothetical protein [Streptomyces sp. NPDC087856]|uniref:hypothetical protein n=1 Tax=Streptomyces sp. NPDC087856 TaxID=3365811 RepID=UPI00381CD702
MSDLDGLPWSQAEQRAAQGNSASMRELGSSWPTNMLKPYGRQGSTSANSPRW